MILPIKMLNFHGDSCQSFQETDFLDDNKIGSSSLEQLVLFDSNSGINVSCNDSRLKIKKIITASSLSPVKM